MRNRKEFVDPATGRKYRLREDLDSHPVYQSVAEAGLLDYRRGSPKPWTELSEEQRAETTLPDSGEREVKGLIDHDMVNEPPHYRNHPSGVECIQITEHLNFCIGNAIKYLWRADDKGDPIENLRKARYYVDREIKRRGGEPE